MHTIKITPNLLFGYQCTSGKLIRLPNRIETLLPELECSAGIHGLYVVIYVCLRIAQHNTPTSRIHQSVDYSAQLDSLHDTDMQHSTVDLSVCLSVARSGRHSLVLC